MLAVIRLRRLPRYARVLALSLLCASATGASAETSSILWVSTLYEGHSFWEQHLRFTEAAAADFGFTVRPVYLDSNPFVYQTVLNEAAGDTSLSAAVLPNLKTQSQRLLGKIEALRIPVVTNVVPMDPLMVGAPQPGTNWLAEVQVDERRNGAVLLDTLLSRVRHTTPDTEATSRVKVLALAGSRTDTVGVARLAGLHDALQREGDAQLLQVFHGERWSREESERIMQTALRRYPDVDVVWAANDDLALGALAAIDAWREPERVGPVVGGIDGTLEMSRHIQAGHACCTIAGLPLHGAWAVVLLADHLSGSSSPSDSGIVPAKSLIVTPENVTPYLDWIGSDPDDIDFRQFSRHNNPDDHRDARQYDFDPLRFLNGNNPRGE